MPFPPTRSMPFSVPVCRANPPWLPLSPSNFFPKPARRRRVLWRGLDEDSAPRALRLALDGITQQIGHFLSAASTRARVLHPLRPEISRLSRPATVRSADRPWRFHAPATRTDGPHTPRQEPNRCVDTKIDPGQRQRRTGEGAHQRPSPLLAGRLLVGRLALDRCHSIL